MPLSLSLSLSLSPVVAVGVCVALGFRVKCGRCFPLPSCRVRIRAADPGDDGHGFYIPWQFGGAPRFFGTGIRCSVFGVVHTRCAGGDCPGANGTRYC
ncbi:hypothetical protein [Streptomyces lycii]|uniref:Secreted protein n=1 Tax=Streptomyces lycii TaxID=2654337 RepID=A0ABQ7F9S6_9ACTN|nr:hypothetical protein [Streptomyces lycii]KAF4405014.1 hypothetical protein GCU69_32520 [Streptomyces lycii]